MRSVFYGTNGTIIVDNTSPTMTVFKQDVFPGMDRHDMPITVPVDINNHNAAGEFKEFYDIIEMCIRDRITILSFPSPSGRAYIM